MIDNISQIAIFILGSLAIILVAKKNKWWFVVGFLSQPFWYITAYLNWQRWIFFISMVYTASWSLWIYEWFFKTEKIKN